MTWASSVEPFNARHFFDPDSINLNTMVLEQDLSQVLALVEHPGLHGGDEGIPADEVPPRSHRNPCGFTENWYSIRGHDGENRRGTPLRGNRFSGPALP